MLISLSANKSSFKTVAFKPGFNIIVATKAESSTEKDSRNGIGKSSLIEIIHFCLGADITQNKGLGRSQLQGWEFTLQMEIHKNTFSLTRGIDSPNDIIVQGSTANWTIQPKLNKDLGFNTISTKNLNHNLGCLFFGLSDNEKSKYNPSFRMLIPYFARRGQEAFIEPFKHFSKQPSWQVQIANTFLLNLNYDYAREWQLLKDKNESIKELKKTFKSGVLENFIGNIGQLEAKKLRLERKLEKADNEVHSFDVHPQYKDIEISASSITRQIHDLNNKNIADLRLIDFYRSAPDTNTHENYTDQLKQVYEEAGIIFEKKTLKTFDEVADFHQKVINNRKDYLEKEIENLSISIEERDRQIKELSSKRAENFKILETHKALDEYSLMQKSVVEIKSELLETETQLRNLKLIKNGESEIKIELEKLLIKAQKDNDEREAHRRMLENIFNSNSEALYQVPGSLIININESGYSFDIEIERSESAGVQLMEVFCYDLLLAELWKKRGTGFLIHDSTIFSDVDERQIAKAIELAHTKSMTNNFQYICCLNSDKIPTGLFSKNFKHTDHVILELKDSPEDACLFGFRF